MDWHVFVRRASMRTETVTHAPVRLATVAPLNGLVFPFPPGNAYGGAVCLVEGNNVTLTSSVFDGNIAEQYGGACTFQG
jgi:hypothetical protein